MRILNSTSINNRDILGELDAKANISHGNHVPDFTGQGGKVVAVNADATGLEFASGGGSSSGNTFCGARVRSSLQYTFNNQASASILNNYLSANGNTSSDITGSADTVYIFNNQAVATKSMITAIALRFYPHSGGRLRFGTCTKNADETFTTKKVSREYTIPAFTATDYLYAEYTCVNWFASPTFLDIIQLDPGDYIFLWVSAGLILGTGSKTTPFTAYPSCIYKQTSNTTFTNEAGWTTVPSTLNSPSFSVYATPIASNGDGLPTAIWWDIVDFDTHNIIDPVIKSRIVMPVGFSKARITYGAVVDDCGYLHGLLYKNGDYENPLQYVHFYAEYYGHFDFFVHGAIPGDYFEIGFWNKGAIWLWSNDKYPNACEVELFT